MQAQEKEEKKTFAYSKLYVPLLKRAYQKKCVEKKELSDELCTKLRREIDRLSQV